MAYQALYRKFRPNSFEDVKGQDHIVSTMRNQIISQRVGHAYLLCGTRGTGKTTIAKLFAKAVNCEEPQNGNPCHMCHTCQSIQAQASFNVIEIDAASNNGVDNIREIKEEVQYSPTEGRYKVYIIDEVHMLSTGAFNALLKTLEEPPSYIIFILATTEAHKVPVTILSRCQRYDFRRIAVETIADRLAELSQSEGIQIESKAIRYIAKMADGSMRDSLSLLDQCVSFHMGEMLTYDDVLEILGAMDTTVFGEMLTYIYEEKMSECILKLEEMIVNGKEISQFVNDFIWYMRNVLLLQNGDEGQEMIDMSKENLLTLQEISKKISQGSLMRYIRIFSDLAGQLRYSAQKRVLTEVALIKLCKPQMEIKADALAERLDKLERLMKKGIRPVEQKESVGDTIEKSNTKILPEKKPHPPALPENLKQITNGWQTLIGDADEPMRGFLKKAHVKPGPNTELVIGIENIVGFDFMNKEEKIEKLEGMIQDKFQVQTPILIQYIGDNPDKKMDFIDMFRELGIDAEIQE